MPMGAPQGMSTRQPASISFSATIRSSVVGEDLEAFFGQDFGSFHQRKDIGLERVGLADHLELDPVGAEDFTRHHGGGDGFIDAVATGGVGQHMHAQLPDQRPEILTRALALHLPAQRDGDDIGF